MMLRMPSELSLQLTVSLRLAVCSRCEHGGVPGKCGGRPRKRAEDLQISSHCLLAQNDFLRLTLDEAQSEEGAKRSRALCNILSGSFSAASRPRPDGTSCCYVTSQFFFPLLSHLERNCNINSFKQTNIFLCFECHYLIHTYIEN